MTQHADSPDWSNPSRRTFGRAAIASGVALASGLTLGQKRVGAVGTLSDTDILNFALNLEYLEAEFYTKATTGKTIADYGIGTGGVGVEGPTNGGREIHFGSNTDGIMAEIANDERNHVQFLRTALGAAAIAKPTIDLDALGALQTDREFLVLARAFEDVGVSAYGGAANLIQSPTILQAAARIALTEAYHAGNIRLIIQLKGIPTQQLDGNDYPPPPTGTKFERACGALKHSSPEDAREALGAVESMRDLADTTLDSVERIVTELRPTVLDRLGLSAAAEWLVADFGRRTGVRAEYLCPGDPSADAAAATALFRVLQEALTNVARHARATHVQAVLSADGPEVCLEVIDNGCGIPETCKHDLTSFGLIGMRERLQWLDGSLTLTGAVGGGTRLVARCRSSRPADT